MLRNSCYKLVDREQGQVASRTICESIGGRLALISSQEEMDAARSYMQNFSGRAFIEGTDAAQEGVWIDAAGNEMPYSGWTVNEPNGGSGENCKAIAASEVLDNDCFGSQWVTLALCEQ